MRLSERDESLYWSDESVGLVQELTGGHPFFIQQLCKAVWEQAYRSDPLEPPTMHPKEVMSAASARHRSAANSFTWLWDGLGHTEKVVASILAESGPEAVSQEVLHLRLLDSDVSLPIDELQDIVHVLKQWDLIAFTDDGYRYRVELLRRWVADYMSPDSVGDEKRLHSMAENLFQAAYGFYQREE